MREAPTVFRSFDAMGTRFECVLGAFTRAVCAAEASAVAEAIEAIVLEESGRLSIFDAQSSLAAVNARAHQGWHCVDADLFDLLERCTGYATDTAGAFDITAGALMRKNGIHGDTQDEPVSTGSGLILLDPFRSAVRFAKAGIRLDLGGIAKGYVLDAAREEMRAHRVTSALVHGGTSSATGIGLAPNGEPWRVRVMSGDSDAPEIELTDRSLACSAPAGRVVNGIGHIMDPRTGIAAQGVDAACVVGESAEVCEVWSTALVVDESLSSAIPEGYECFVSRGGLWESHLGTGECGAGTSGGVVLDVRS